MWKLTTAVYDHKPPRSSPSCLHTWFSRSTATASIPGGNETIGISFSWQLLSLSFTVSAEEIFRIARYLREKFLSRSSYLYSKINFLSILSQFSTVVRASEQLLGDFLNNGLFFPQPVSNMLGLIFRQA